MEASAIILAAGKGTRMRSKVNKVLHPLCGKPVVGHVLQACLDADITASYMVVGPDEGEALAASLGAGPVYVPQPERLGTAHAALQVAPHYRGEGLVYVLAGDAPLITAATLRQMREVLTTSNADGVLLTAVLPEPGDYGRVLREAGGLISGLVEAKDATPTELAINEINTGFYLFKAERFFPALTKIQNNNTQGEYYLTDVIGIIHDEGGRVVPLVSSDEHEALGINDRIRLAEAEAVLRRRIRERLMLSGVTFLQPESCLVDVDVVIGQDTLVYPNVILQGSTVIGEDCLIGPNTHLTDCLLGSKVRVEHSVARESTIGDSAQIGPYAYLRPGTRLASHVKIGDFVEVKNSEVGEGSKIPHHSYVGDAEIGAGVNIGAGTIFVNYDGEKKQKVTVGDRAFIGCNSNLVAPLVIADEAYVAAGSTITETVPAGSLALARARQINKPGWVARRRAKKDQK